ncbi:hypothetical protein [Streptomyces sp. NPDC046870]|uniref:hypothetical protein n=1 Tax=Streptomyces sp. NPDC046870 TaxID=3155135 RepID=UPI003453D853
MPGRYGHMSAAALEEDVAWHSPAGVRALAFPHRNKQALRATPASPTSRAWNPRPAPKHI